MKKTIPILIAIMLWAFLSVRATEVSGRVVKKGRANAAAVTTIVYLESLDGHTPLRAGRYKLVQRDKAFVPRVLAVPLGSTVDFPNADPIFHNVFSLSRPGPFDLGLYRAGGSKSRVFSEPATHRVFCNIHAQMTAVILVLPTSLISEVDSTGSYRLEVPAGRYRVTAWSERSQPASQEIAVASSAVTAPELSLDESKFVDLSHPNKYGQEYPPSSYNPMRDGRH